jgi:hypothetical protein
VCYEENGERGRTSDLSTSVFDFFFSFFAFLISFFISFFGFFDFLSFLAIAFPFAKLAAIRRASSRIQHCRPGVSWVFRGAAGHSP